jgi:hypothetical protein
LRFGFRHPAGPGCIFLAAILFLGLVSLPKDAFADSLGLLVQEDYNSGDFKTTDLNGIATKTSFTNFEQLYNLSLNKLLFPNLGINAGGLFTKTTSTLNGISSPASDQYNAYANIQLNVTPFYSAIGYTRNVQATANISKTDERYDGTLSYRSDPELPTFFLNYSKDFAYDNTHLLFNTDTDDISMNIAYNLKNLSTRYGLNYSDQLDKINDRDNTSLQQTADIAYGNTFFNKRVTVGADYNISSQTSELTGKLSGGQGLLLQLFPVHGLSGISDLNNPSQTPVMITLNENPALIDGNETATAGINLGLSSGLITIPPPPRQEWNIGADFVTPTQLSSLDVWVDKDLTKIISLFHWDVYTSDDNVTWAKKFTVTAAPSDFVTFPTPHFIINFPAALTTRFIKVVVKPLDINDQTTIIGNGLNPDDFRNIAVTELQAFISKTSNKPTTSASASILTQRFNLNSRTRILKSWNLYYEQALFMTMNSPGATTAFLSDGLSLYRKLSEIIMLNARAARLDNFLDTGHGVGYQYSAGLTATPLPTLSDSLIYSGHYNINADNTTNLQNSIFIYNTAALYTGIAANLGGGVTLGKVETGQNITSLQGNAAVSLVPNPELNVNLLYNISSSSSSGGGRASISTTNYLASASATYTPVSALYLFGSIGLQRNSNVLQTVENYGANFSPFPGGQLQLHFSYNETVGPASNEKSRLISPSLRWNIRPGAYLDLTYSIQEDKLAAQANDSNIFSADLKVVL